MPLLTSPPVVFSIFSVTTSLQQVFFLYVFMLISVVSKHAFVLMCCSLSENGLFLCNSCHSLFNLPMLRQVSSKTGSPPDLTYKCFHLSLNRRWTHGCTRTGITSNSIDHYCSLLTTYYYYVTCILFFHYYSEYESS